MQTLNYRRLLKQQLNEIKLLWSELNQVHLHDSVYFKDYYTTFTFEKRIVRWKNIPEEDIYILTVETEEGNPVGYCVSTFDKEQSGEIDSLFLLPYFRGNGIGKKLMMKSIQWLENRNCKTIRLSVSYGHEEVLRFYQKMGFFPRLTVLEWKKTREIES